MGITNRRGPGKVRLTRQDERRNNKEQARIDHNRRLQVKAIRELERCLHLMERREFTGSVVITVSGKDGRLGRARVALTTYP